MTAYELLHKCTHCKGSLYFYTGHQGNKSPNYVYFKGKYYCKQCFKEFKKWANKIKQ